MAPTEARVAARARRAYELGRLWAAARVGWIVAPMVVIAAPVCGQPRWAALAGVVLFLLGTALRWRGEEYAEAVHIGLVAGAAPLGTALLFRSLGNPCTMEFCFTMNIPICIAGGLIAGVAVALRAKRVARRRVAFVVAGCLVAGVTGALGCIFSGVAGLLGLGAGVLLGSAPVLVWARLARR